MGRSGEEEAVSGGSGVSVFFPIKEAVLGRKRRQGGVSVHFPRLFGLGGESREAELILIVRQVLSRGAAIPWPIHVSCGIGLLA